jgi:hypothetical protein
MTSPQQSSRPGDIELAVALGRIEEMLKSMNEKLDRLDTTAADHADVLRKHTVEIELLKQRQGPKVHWSAWVLAFTSMISLAITITVMVVR